MAVATGEIGFSPMALPLVGAVAIKGLHQDRYQFMDAFDGLYLKLAQTQRGDAPPRIATTSSERTPTLG